MNAMFVWAGQKLFFIETCYDAHHWDIQSIIVLNTLVSCIVSPSFIQTPQVSVQPIYYPSPKIVEENNYIAVMAFFTAIQTQ